MPLNQVTAMVGGQLRRHITGYHMSKLTTEALRILTELAFAIDDRHIPIDYRRRRGLAASTTLIDDATWARMTREAGMRLPPAGSARRYLYELLTGCALVTAPPPYRLSAGSAGGYNDFVLGIPASLAAALAGHARRLLDGWGIGGEPLHWQPPDDGGQTAPAPVNHVAVSHKGKLGQRLPLSLHGLEQTGHGVSSVGEGLDPVSPDAYRVDQQRVREKALRFVPRVPPRLPDDRSIGLLRLVHRLLERIRPADHRVGVENPHPPREPGDSQREERQGLVERRAVHGVARVRDEPAPSGRVDPREQLRRSVLRAVVHDDYLQWFPLEDPAQRPQHERGELTRVVRDRDHRDPAGRNRAIRPADDAVRHARSLPVAPARDKLFSSPRGSLVIMTRRLARNDNGQPLIQRWGGERPRPTEQTALSTGSGVVALYGDRYPASGR
jgi:hypothetical protein